MRQYNSILVCVQKDTDSVKMLEQAILLAKKHKAAIKLMHVVSDYPEDTSEWWNVRNPDKLKRKVIEERQSTLDDMVALAEEQGVDRVTSELRWGRTFLAVTREVMKNKHDLVKITEKESSKVSRLLQECPSRDLMSHCPGTLWISKGKTGTRPKRVLATLGGTRNDIACDALDVKVLRTAAAIAEANRSELHYLHAMPLYGDKGIKGKKLRSDLADYIKSLKKTFMQKCGSVVTEYEIDVDDDRIHLVTGSPAAVIAETVSDMNFDLVIMGARPHADLQTILLGTRAMRVFDYLKCDVVGVKPDDFVSLVESEGALTDENQTDASASNG